MRLACKPLLFLFLFCAIHCYSYRYKNYDTMVATMKQLAVLYPDLVDFTSVQRSYGFKSSLKCGKVLCEHWFLRLYNHRVHNETSNLPQVFLSGELHGNERVAPTAVLELAILLCQNRAFYDPSFKENGNDSFQQIPKSNFDPYLSFLLDSREIIIMPMTNAYGYYHSMRTEVTIDVNRDFPFDLTVSPSNCLMSETAKAIQTLYLHNMFIATLTYHGGMQSITYEWGDYFNYHQHALSPDHNAMKDIAESMGRLCGGSYVVGPTNQIVYPVHGGMEEWGYAGSWFNQLNSKKTIPATCGKNEIPVMMTNCSNRCLTFLIEVSDNKIPPEKALGDNHAIWDLLYTNSSDYVNVIIRQSFVLLDVLMSYSVITDVSVNENAVSVNWVVGGCFEVDDTQILVFSDIPELHPFSSSSGFSSGDLSDDEYQRILAVLKDNKPIANSNSFQASSPLRNKSRDSFLISSSSNQMRFNSTMMADCSQCILIAISHVDSYMEKNPPKSNPQVRPQSHYSRLHSDNSYTCNDGVTKRMIRGRHMIISRPYVLTIENVINTEVPHTTNIVILAKLKKQSIIVKEEFVWLWIVIDCVVVALLVLVCVLYNVCG